MWELFNKKKQKTSIFDNPLPSFASKNGNWFFLSC